MYHSDREDLDSDALSHGKFHKKKLFKKTKTTEEDKENSIIYKNSLQSATEESTDYTGSFSRKVVIQDCIDLRNIVKSSVEGINDILSNKLYKIDKFEIINEEKEEDVKRPTSICPNIVVRKKTLNETKSERETPKSTIQSFNYTYTYTFNNQKTKPKTRNLSGQKKTDSFVSNKLINKEIKEIKDRKETKVGNPNPKPTSKSKSNLLEIKNFNKSKNIIRKQTDTSICNSNTQNLTRNISSENQGKDLRIKTKRLSDNKHLTDLSKNISKNKENSLNMSVNKAKEKKFPSLTSRTSKEKINSIDNTVVENTIEMVKLSHMIKVFNEFSLDKAIHVNAIDSSIKNLFDSVTYKSYILNSEDIKDISSLSKENKAAIRIQNMWKKYKIKKLLNVKSDPSLSMLEYYHKKHIYNKLTGNSDFIYFINMMNAALKSFSKLYESNGKFIF